MIWDEFIEIDTWEGPLFLEKFERGAFTKTIQEQRGPIAECGEDATGAFYGSDQLIGGAFRFQVIRDQVQVNSEGVIERTIKEARLRGLYAPEPNEPEAAVEASNPTADEVLDPEPSWRCKQCGKLMTGYPRSYCDPTCLRRSRAAAAAPKLP